MKLLKGSGIHRYHPIYDKFKSERKEQLIAAYPFINAVHFGVLCIFIPAERFFINSSFLLLMEIIVAGWLVLMRVLKLKNFGFFEYSLHILYGLEVFLFILFISAFASFVAYYEYSLLGHTVIVLVLMLGVGAEFLPAYSLRQVLPVCIGLPLLMWYAAAYFLLDSGPETMILALFPLAAWVLGTLTSTLIERVYYREFRMRYLAERRREKVNEELSRYENLNKKLEETKESLEKEIEDRKRVEKKLEQFAAFDELTSVYNRRAGLELLKEALHYAKRKQQPLTVAFVDVDKLKIVNDNFGHQAGDTYLKEVVELLRTHLRKSDSVSRFGGDEFLILLTECKKEEALAIFKRIEEDIEHINQSDRMYPLNFSYGIAETDPGFEESMHQLIAKADERMYVHKQQKKWS